ncbi:MAG: hypothetical protein WC876_11365 [Candidatus Thermoplasmatota archaeon]|jgi:uncharacterized coiled-coil DUF342 family protein
MTAAETTSPPTTAPPAAVAEAPVEAKAEAFVGDIRNLQDKFNSLLEQRNSFNDLARKAADERNQLNEQRRSKAAGIDASKVARDAANEEMRKHKELRNAYQDQAKALIAEKKGKAGAVSGSLPLTVRKLRNELQAMVEQQQTTTLTIAKERVLVEKIAETWKELKAKEAELLKQKSVQVDLSDVDQSIDALFAKADEQHELVTKFMKEAQANHEAFIAAVKETRVLVNEANAKHAEFVACKMKADEYHTKGMELREKVMQVRGERKAEFDASRKELQEVNTVARRNVADPRAIERAQDSALEQLKKGGKIKLGF